MDSSQVSKTRWWRTADRIGAAASFLCALHCAALPFVLALLPLIGLEFLADHRFERGFVIFACVLALISLFSGYRRHRRVLPLRLAFPGLALLLIGVTLGERSIYLHSALVTCGGLLVASAHFINLRADSHRGHVHSADCAH